MKLQSGKLNEVQRKNMENTSNKSDSGLEQTSLISNSFVPL